MRSLAININAMDFVHVARARGERTSYVMLAEILPNMIRPVLADFGLRFVFIVLLLSGLSASSVLAFSRRTPTGAGWCARTSTACVRARRR